MTSLMGLVEQIMSAPDEDRRALWAMLSPEEMVAIREVLDSADAEEWIAGRAAAELRAEAEVDGPTWVRTMFPLLARGGFAPHMADLWRWAWGIEPRVRSRPYVAAWFRGGAKSSTAESIVAALGARNRRHYCLYISGTQDQADKHVGSIGALLESRRFAAAYPEMARRAVGQYGASKGWSRTRLSTSTGFTIDALGLGVDARGIRMEDERPDLIILDDVDALTDGPAAVKKKIDLITQTILPSGSKDLIVLAIQNIIHPNSVFARLANVAEETADFLADRIVSGPVPAVHGLDVEPEEQADGGTRWVVKGGVPTWEFYDLETVQAAIDTEGLTAFLREAQHQVEAAPGGMFDHLVFRRCRPDEVPPLLRKVCWMDPAVTDTDASDSQGIQIDGIAADHTIYRLWSWEARTSPQRALTLAVRMAVEYGCGYVGVETDQGGDTWRSVYNEAAEAVRTGADGGEPITDHRMPGFTYEKAGSGHGSKVHRASQMLADYERAQAPVHVLGTHVVLEAALRRFPKTKPLDLCLAAGTLITTDEGRVPIEDVRRGDTVLTRDGWRPVVAAGMTSPKAQLWRLSVDGGWLDGTAEHPVWVEGRGWVPLAEVRYGDIVLACDRGMTMADSPAFRPAVQAGRLLTSLSSTAPRSSSMRAATTTARSGRARRTARNYIERSGSRSTAPSLMAWIFTTSTAIIATTTRRTWRRSLASNTDVSTARRGSRRHYERTSKRSDPSHRSGIDPTRGANGTESTASAPGKGGSTGRWSAPSAARTSRPAAAARRVFARLVAATRLSTATPLTTRTESAPSAEPHSRRGSTASRPIAGARVRAVSRLVSTGPVYNLTVSGTPEFFANGVLVHNCDASFYGWLDLRMGRATKIKTPTGSIPPTPISRQATVRMATVGRVTRTR